MAASDMASTVVQLKTLANDVPKDEKARKELFEAARNLTFALESPGDTIQRICYLVHEAFSIVPQNHNLNLLILACEVVADTTDSRSRVQ